MWVEMTWEQRTYYKAIFENQAHVLLSNNSKKNLPNMRNLAMELRKVCNHPFLCNGIEEDYKQKRIVSLAAVGTPPPSELDLLTHSCGKMVLLLKLLPKLKAEGKKARGKLRAAQPLSPRIASPTARAANFPAPDRLLLFGLSALRCCCSPEC